MSGFATSAAGLQAAASQLVGVAEDLDAEFAVLKRLVEGLLDAGWTGVRRRVSASAGASGVRATS